MSIFDEQEGAVSLLDRNDKVFCLSCGETFEELAEDHVIPGHVGLDGAVTDNCGSCHARYIATPLADGRIEIYFTGDVD